MSLRENNKMSQFNAISDDINLDSEWFDIEYDNKNYNAYKVINEPFNIDEMSELN